MIFRQVYLAAAFVFVVLSALFMVACGGDSDSDDLFRDSDYSPVVIGPAGGSVRATDGKARLVVPAGALNEPVEISLEAFEPELNIQEGTARFYRAKPDGLTFALPATLEADTEDIFESHGLPVLLSGSQTFGAEVLADQEIERALDTEVTIARGSVLHFSTFTVAHTSFMPAIDDVPFVTQANAPFGPVRASVSVSSTLPKEFVIGNYYYLDLSSDPVLLAQAEPVQLRNDTGSVFLDAEISKEVSADIAYRCGNSGRGTFRGRIVIAGRTTLSLRETATDEIAFPPGFLGTKQEDTSTQFIEHSFNQMFTGTRVVDCLASGAEVTPTPESTPEETPGETADPTASEAPTDAAPTATPAASPVETETPADQDDPFAQTSLETSKNALSFNHGVGSSPCPQTIGTVIISNEGPGATAVNVSTSTGALTADVSNFSLAVGESREVQLLFTCSQTSSFTGTVTFAPGAGGTPATVRVNGTVQ